MVGGEFVKIEEKGKIQGNMEGTGIDTFRENREQMQKNHSQEPGVNYQELEMTSRFVDTHRDTSYSNAHLQLHSHTFYELLYCCNTCGAEYLVGAAFEKEDADSAVVHAVLDAINRRIRF